MSIPYTCPYPAASPITAHLAGSHLLSPTLLDRTTDFPRSIIALSARSELASSARSLSPFGSRPYTCSYTCPFTCPYTCLCTWSSFQSRPLSVCSPTHLSGRPSLKLCMCACAEERVCGCAGMCKRMHVCVHAGLLAWHAVALGCVGSEPPFMQGQFGRGTEGRWWGR